jgi:glutaminase
MYSVIGLTFVLNYVVNSSNTLVTDPAGVVWHTGSITESAAIVSIYTMLFAAALAAVKLVQRSAEVAQRVGEGPSGETFTNSYAEIVKERAV